MGERTWWMGPIAALALSDYLQTGPKCADKQHLPPMPAQLADLLQRCFQQNPADRPATMALVADELIAIARQGLRATMGITHAPDTVFVKSWPRGIPNYRVGHLGRVATIDRLLSDHPGLSLNANAYRGIGINDCVANSRITATAITG